MPVPQILMGLAALASLVGGAASATSRAKDKAAAENAAEAEEKKRERMALRQALARSLGVENEPYINPNVEQPKSSNTAWSDILQGVGQMGMQAGAQYGAEKMYPAGGTSTGIETKRIPRRTPYGYNM